MRAWGHLDDALRELVRLRSRELALRLAILLGPAVFLLALHAAGTARGWLSVLAALLALLTVLQPDAEAGLLTCAVLVYLWWAGVAQPYTPWTLVAGLSLLLFHVTTTASARAPLGGRLPMGSFRRWAGRTGVVAVMTCAAYGVGAAFAGLDTGGSAVLTSIAAVAVLAGVLGARHLSAARGSSPPAG